jgi:hypothetical protein
LETLLRCRYNQRSVILMFASEGRLHLHVEIVDENTNNLLLSDVYCLPSRCAGRSHFRTCDRWPLDHHSRGQAPRQRPFGGLHDADLILFSLGCGVRLSALNEQEWIR